MEALSRSYILGPGTHYLKVTPLGSQYDQLAEPTPYEMYYRATPRYYAGLQRCASIETDYDDPLYGCQWHLNNTEENGVHQEPWVVGSDINVEEAWAQGVLGEGTYVQIIDSGMDSDHPDITDNVDKSRNHNAFSGGFSQYRSNGHSVHNPRNFHGSRMAGLIAARDNDIGYRGVAPRATIYLHNAVEPQLASAYQMATAITREINTTEVSSNSYEMASAPKLGELPDIWRRAIETALKDGNRGKGISFVFSVPVLAVDRPGTDTNITELTSHPGVITVCAVDEFGQRIVSSGTGYTNWICTPGGSHAPTVYNGYTVTTLETASGATAVASGVTALVRSANDNLTWRDVKLILAASAQKNDPSHADWEEGALHYEDPSNRYHYNPSYGFGVPDAGRAVTLAKGWTRLPKLQTQTVSTKKRLKIPDRLPEEEPQTVASTLNFDQSNTFVEFVELQIEFDHEQTRDLRITLESQKERPAS